MAMNDRNVANTVRRVIGDDGQQPLQSGSTIWLLQADPSH